MWSHHALLHNLKHDKILHERNILVTVDVQDIPYVSSEARYDVEILDKNFLSYSLEIWF